MMKIEVSETLKKLPAYLFVEIDKAKKKALDEKRDIIDLGVGDPDMPTPRFIVDALKRAVDDPKTHRYALDQGLPELRRAFAKWYQARFGIELDPETEVLPLIGSKEGIAHIPLAFINPGDLVLIPDPCYPPYRSGTIFAGGEVLPMPLLESYHFLPDLRAIKGHLLHKVKMMFLSYPNNPTGAVATGGFFDEVISFAARHNIIVCHDAAYSEIAFDGYRSPSILESKGAKGLAIEFHSLSKTFNMTGWRVGFACGNSALIAGLAKVKSNIDSGIFTAIQRAAIAALENYNRHIDPINKIYSQRRDALVDGLNSIGWNLIKPKATFYIWAKAKGRFTSTILAKEMLEKCDIIVTPGNGFGEHGEGYIRMALTVDTPRLREAVDRIKKRLG